MPREKGQNEIQLNRTDEPAVVVYLSEAPEVLRVLTALPTTENAMVRLRLAAFLRTEGNS